MPEVIQQAGGTPITAREFELFRDLIRAQTGIFLKDTKRSLVTSRLSRRLRELSLASYTEYYRLMKQGDAQGEELRRMINCITTNKTSFFREEEHFHFLRESVTQRVRRDKGERKLRIWCAASSTGEEPYTIAMTVLEGLNGASGWDVRILASDIDTDVLAKAEKATYSSDSLEGLDDRLKRRYFLRGRAEWEGYVQVKPEVRRLVHFQRVNLVDRNWPLQGRSMRSSAGT